MGTGRFLSALFFMLSLAIPSQAVAGWWFGEESQWEKSGLDLEHGYDRNTVVTQGGKVISMDIEGSSGPALAVIQDSSVTTLVLGPKGFWRTSGLPLKHGDNVIARGSKAVGKDGTSYLIVQNISIPSTGSEITLRNNSGRPSWSGNNRPERQRPVQMRQFRGGRPGR